MLEKILEIPFYNAIAYTICLLAIIVVAAKSFVYVFSKVFNIISKHRGYNENKHS